MGARSLIQLLEREDTEESEGEYGDNAPRVAVAFFPFLDTFWKKKVSLYIEANRDPRFIMELRFQYVLENVHTPE